MAKPRKVVLVAIAGPSCSGKTAVAQGVAQVLHPVSAAVLMLDSYYRDLSHLAEDVRAATNFDDPSALDWDLLVSHVESLSQGVAVEVPHYDFATHTRQPGFTHMPAKPVVILEGLFALYDPRVRELSSLRVYIDLDDEEGLCRRVRRDTQERGRSARFAEEQYRQQVAPLAGRYVLPSRAFADLVVNGRDPVEVSVATIAQRLYPKLPRH